MAIQYTSNSTHHNSPYPKRDWWRALKRGSQNKCPSCGQGKMMESYLQVSPRCPDCSEELHHHRADDAPPYFTIFLVGHIVIPLLVLVEMNLKPEMWVHMVIWLPLATLLSLYFLPIIKGALVGYQWALYMHGFDPEQQDETEKV